MIIDLGQARPSLLGCDRASLRTVLAEIAPTAQRPRCRWEGIDITRLLGDSDIAGQAIDPIQLALE